METFGTLTIYCYAVTIRNSGELRNVRKAIAHCRMVTCAEALELKRFHAEATIASGIPYAYEWYSDCIKL